MTSRWRWALALFALLAIVVPLRALPVPSHAREWVVPQSRLPSARIEPGRVTIRDVRNFRYGPGGEVVRADWDERVYDPARLSSAWLGLSPFGMPGVGHVFVSFGFDDGRYLAVSVEARREVGETYSPLRGLFRRYELVYVIADERDVVALRSNVSRDDVYLYPVKAPAAALQATFLDMLARANDIARQAEFYDTVFNSCASNVARHVNRIAPGAVPPSVKVLLAGWSDELALELGLLDFDGTIDEARARFRVNERAAGDVDAGDFSARIRAAGPG